MRNYRTPARMAPLLVQVSSLAVESRCFKEFSQHESEGSTDCSQEICTWNRLAKGDVLERRGSQHGISAILRWIRARPKARIIARLRSLRTAAEVVTCHWRQRRVKRLRGDSMWAIWWVDNNKTSIYRRLVNAQPYLTGEPKSIPVSSYWLTTLVSLKALIWQLYELAEDYGWW